jgi:hypothetical protein
MIETNIVEILLVATQTKKLEAFVDNDDPKQRQQKQQQ